MLLQTEELTKAYGNTYALNRVSLEFRFGVYGILGPNGSGKSTLFNLITDNLSATSGGVLLDGSEILSLGRKYREQIGYMPQQQGFYDDFTVTMFLQYFARLKGMNKAATRASIETILPMVNLMPQAHDRIRSLSGGMKQRLLFAQALLGNPKILILDEPTAGLDPKERINFRNMLAELSQNKIILLATHIVSDIECIADEVILLKKGRVIQKDTPENLMKGVQGKVFEVRDKKRDLLALQQTAGLGNIIHDQNGISLRIVTDDPQTDYLPVQNISLEDVYLYYFEYLK